MHRVAGDDPNRILAHAGQFAPTLASDDRDWNGVRVHYRPYQPHEMQLPPLPDHLLVVAGEGTCHLTQQRDGEIRATSIGLGGAVLLPAGHESYWCQRGSGHVLHLLVDPAFVDAVAEQSDIDPGRVELQHTFGTHDPRIDHVATALKRELETDNIGGRVYAESLATMLAVHLLRSYSNLTRTAIDERSHGLPARELRRAIDYVDDHLAHDLTLAELAGAANVSAFHFTRRFKQAMGLPPHQYVLRRRVERAMELLVGSELSIAEVALAVGFANHSHLAKHFRRLVGLSPGAFRRQERRASHGL